MSSIAWQAYQHPVVKAALDEAHDLIGAWMARDLYAGTEEMAETVVGGWAAAGLQQRIARAILDAKGFDYDRLEELIEQHWHNPADALGIFDRELRNTCGKRHCVKPGHWEELSS